MKQNWVSQVIRSFTNKKKNFETFWYKILCMKIWCNSRNLCVQFFLVQIALILLDKNMSILFVININIGNIATTWYKKLCMKS